MLRDYQKQSIDQIRAEFQKGKTKVLLHLATGGGKTVIFCDLLKAASLKSKKTLVVVRGRKLVDQASQRLVRESVEHGVLMAGHWNYRPHLPNQVASIDTLIARKLKPNADLIIIDEAHMAASKGYKEFLAQYKDVFILSVTATPYVDKSMRHIADTVVQPITMQGLVDLGFLVPFKYFAPSSPDLDKVKVSSSTKDYVNEELEIAMSKNGLTGKVIDHWKKLAEGRPTLCFAVNIHHSKTLTERFIEAGIPAEHCDADSSDAERNAVIRRLESGQTKVVCNVGIFCTGIDIPSLGAIIMARPTKSKNLYIQQAGRGTRIFPGKQNCILIDHASNILRLGFPTEEQDVDLDGKGTVSTPMESKVCDECFAVYRGKKCPECGAEKPEKTKTTNLQESDEELKEIKHDTIMELYLSLQREGKATKKKPSWAKFRLINKVGFDVAKNYLDAWFIDNVYMKNTTASPFSNSPFNACQKASGILKK